MIKTTTVSLFVAATTAVIALPATAHPGGAASRYDNCTALHAVWPHGVGKKHAHDHTSGTPVTNFKHSTHLYKVAMRHNSDLDRDKDGIACESR